MLATPTRGPLPPGPTKPGMCPERKCECIRITPWLGRPAFTLAPTASSSMSPVADWSSKRVFLLGPSHHHYLSKAALSRCTQYATPIGNLRVDHQTTASLYSSGQFEWMSQSVDEDEHSLEMHLPYIFKILAKYIECQFQPCKCSD